MKKQRIYFYFFDKLIATGYLDGREVIKLSQV